MRIGLADIKKRISRSVDGELVVTPHLLGPRQLVLELEALIALYEAHVGRERSAFPLDRPAEIIGDYRLARCLVLCLSEWYVWRPAVWPGSASPEEVARLAAQGIDSSARLRLALYDAVNGVHNGYLPASKREHALADFADRLGITRRTLDDLLWLDADERMSLVRECERPPTPRELAVRYNQQVLEAFLTNASHVEWQIPAPGTPGLPLGTIVKRVCFLARRMGVQYDVTLADAPGVTEPEESTQHAMVPERRAGYMRAPAELSASTRQVSRDTSITLTLFGPLEVTGAPQQYGERLARLCRALLGYRRQVTANGKAVLTTLDGALGSARVYVRGRPMRLRLDERFLKLIAPATAERREAAGPAGAGEEQQFDSVVEERFAAELASLERSGEAHGWRMEREPEPVIVGDTILVPDFALTRGAQRVYLEIAGYWRPEYRERKARKLLTVRDAVNMVVAAPEAARADFAALEASLPVLWYRDVPQASALLALLDAHFDDFQARLIRVDAARLVREVAVRGYIPVVESMALLHCYSRSEVARALALLRPQLPSARESFPMWVESVGLCDPEWLEAQHEHLRWALEEAGGRIALPRLAELLAGRSPSCARLTEDGVEALAVGAGLHVVRASLFAAEVFGPDAAATDASADRDIPAARTERRQAQPRRGQSRKNVQSAPVPQSLFPLE